MISLDHSIRQADAIYGNADTQRERDMSDEVSWYGGWGRPTMV